MRIVKKLLFLLLAVSFFIHPAFSMKMKTKKKLPQIPDLGFVGQLVYVEGDVTAKRVKAPDWLSAFNNMPDYLFDEIKTGDKSKTTLEFKDGTQVAINPGSEVLIDTNSSVKDVTKRTLLKRVVLTLGTIWCKVTKQQPNESFVVETRGGVLGVRGTQFWVTTTGNDQMQVYVEEGTVMVGPSVDQLTQAVYEGHKAIIQDGQVRQDVEYARGAFNFGSAVCGCVPWQYGFGVNVAVDIATGSDAPDIAIDLARDYASSYVPYGGYVNGFFGSSNFFGGGPPPQPSNLQPQGMVTTYTPTFSWGGINGAKQYAILVSKAPFQKDMPKEDWQWIARVDKTFATYPYVANELSPGTTYYWTVVALDEKGKVVGKGSTPVSFTMAGTDVLGRPDFYPAATNPLNQTVYTPLPTFSWNAMNGAASYAVLVGSKLKGDQLDSDFAVATIDTGATSATYNLTDEPLQPGQTYYWSVVALDPGGKAFSRPSPPASFTLPPSGQMGPTPVFPLGQIKSQASLRFEWRGWMSNISGYKVVVSTSPDLSRPQFEQTVTTPWLDLPDAGSRFIAGTTYYWGVKYLNLGGAGLGVKSPVASFVITP